MRCNQLVTKEVKISPSSVSVSSTAVFSVSSPLPLPPLRRVLRPRRPRLDFGSASDDSSSSAASSPSSLVSSSSSSSSSGSGACSSFRRSETSQSSPSSSSSGMSNLGVGPKLGGSSSRGAASGFVSNVKETWPGRSARDCCTSIRMRSASRFLGLPTAVVRRSSPASLDLDLGRLQISLRCSVHDFAENRNRMRLRVHYPACTRTGRARRKTLA